VKNDFIAIVFIPKIDQLFQYLLWRVKQIWQFYKGLRDYLFFYKDFGALKPIPSSCSFRTALSVCS